MKTLKFKAVYENELHEIYGIKLPELYATIPLNRFPFSETVKVDRIIEYIGKHDINENEIYEGDYDLDGNCVVWCDNCNSWQFAQIDVPTKDICISCHWCDGNFDLQDHLNEFEIIGNIYIK